MSMTEQVETERPRIDDPAVAPLVAATTRLDATHLADDGAPTFAGRIVRALKAAAPPLIALALALLLWRRVAASNPYVLPKLGGVGDALRNDPGLFARNAKATLTEAFAGLGIGMTTGLVLAVLMSEVPVIRRALLPIAVVLNVTPVVAIAPALVVAFGFGSAPKIAIAAIITFFPTLINSLAGLQQSDASANDVFRTLHASRIETLLKLRIPSALPFFLAAARVCFPLSLIGAVVGEFVAAGSAEGLGNMITVASMNSNLKLVYASVACLAAFGVALSLAIGVIEKIVLDRMGHPSRRR
jgi:NitT/TauT family transport system permease protein